LAAERDAGLAEACPAVVIIIIIIIIIIDQTFDQKAAEVYVDIFPLQ
jgi:hypothetical protein